MAISFLISKKHLKLRKNRRLCTVGQEKSTFRGGWDFELTGQYLSRVRTVQGRQSGYAFMDLGARKKILEGRGVFNLSVRDVFASRIREFRVEQEGFFLYDWGQRGRFIILGYGFGKGVAMEFSGQERF